MHKIWDELRLRSPMGVLCTTRRGGWYERSVGARDILVQGVSASILGGHLACNFVFWAVSTKLAIANRITVIETRIEHRF